MRAARLRRASGGAQEGSRGRSPLTAVEVHSAHLPDTRVGPITVWTSPRGVRHIEFGALPRERNTDPPDTWPPGLRAAVDQVREYLAKERRTFDLELDFADAITDFQRHVYERLLAVEHGHVTSYGKIAEEIGKPDQARAVGQAVGANPIPIVIPCHRVVGSDLRLIGFSGGLAVKASLLKLEGVDVDGVIAKSRVRPEVIPLDL